MGFEPTVHLYSAQRFSKPPPSAARPPLRVDIVSFFWHQSQATRKFSTFSAQYGKASMATFRKIVGAKGTRHQAIVRLLSPSLYRVFTLKADAVAWARKVERAIEDAENGGARFDRDVHLTDKPKPVPMDAGPTARSTLGEVIKHYRLTVTPKNRGADEEANRLAAWEARDVAKIEFGKVSSDDIHKILVERVEAGRAANTIRNDMFCLSAVFEHAALPTKSGGAGGWGWKTGNPIRGIELPKAGDPRKRRFKRGEEPILRKALEGISEPTQMIALLDVLLATGMRLGEAASCGVNGFSRVKTSVPSDCQALSRKMGYPEISPCPLRHGKALMPSVVVWKQEWRTVFND